MAKQVLGEYKKTIKFVFYKEQGIGENHDPQRSERTQHIEE